MARSFSDDERQHIRQALIDKGRDIFIRYGLRKTSVEDIATAVGISKGSFYNFFRSKEHLFFEIREIEEQELKTNFLEEVFPNGEVNRGTLRAFLTGMFKSVERSPFLAILMNEGEREYLFRKIPPRELEAHQKSDIAFLTELVVQWQEKGVVRCDLPSGQVVGIIASLLAIPLMRELLPIENYDEMIGLLSDIVISGLLQPEGKA